MEEMVPFECSERHRLPPLPSRMVLPVTREAPPRVRVRVRIRVSVRVRVTTGEKPP